MVQWLCTRCFTRKPWERKLEGKKTFSTKLAAWGPAVHFGRPEAVGRAEPGPVGSLAKRTRGEKTVRGEASRRSHGAATVQPAQASAGTAVRCHPANSSSAFTGDIPLASPSRAKGAAGPGGEGATRGCDRCAAVLRGWTGDCSWDRGSYLSFLGRGAPGKGAAQQRCAKISASKTLSEKTSLSFITVPSESGSGPGGSREEGDLSSEGGSLLRLFTCGRCSGDS